MAEDERERQRHPEDDRPEQVLAETLSAALSERGATRMDDRANAAAMERRKVEGYF